MLSIAGRGLNVLGLGPIPGDFELVEAGTAFAVFAFLPWCHLRRGHVTVDIFLSRAGPRVNFAVDALANLLMLGASGLIAWRLFLGLRDKMAYGETSFILQFPLWWSYAASLIGAAVFLIVCLWCFWRSLREYRAGQRLDPPGAGAS